MAGIGDKSSLRGDKFVEAIRHLVEGVDEGDDLGRATGLLCPAIQRPASNARWVPF